MLAKMGRAIAATIAMVALLAAAPSTALAEGEGIWSQWASEVTDRESKAEVPFAILFSIPPMIVITPFWLVKVAMEETKTED